MTPSAMALARALGGRRPTVTQEEAEEAVEYFRRYEEEHGRQALLERLRRLARVSPEIGVLLELIEGEPATQVGTGREDAP